MPKEKIELYSPAGFQVFQRYNKFEGRVLINGCVNFKCKKIRYKIEGNGIRGKLKSELKEIDVCEKTGIFSEEIILEAGGWYKLTVQAENAKNRKVEYIVEKFGVGEIFIGAGQSNSTNCGEYRTKQKSGMVASFNGYIWQISDDPFSGVQDKSDGGSYYPAFGDILYEKYKVPVAIASTGFGGTTALQWQWGGQYFEWMIARIFQLGKGGFRAVLWHQGESDSFKNYTEYFIMMEALIKSSWARAGWFFPWFTAIATYHNASKPSDAIIRKAQMQLRKEKLSLEGPDTDKLTGDCRDQNGAGIHFSPKGLKLHGEMWAEKVIEYLDGIL